MSISVQADAHADETGPYPGGVTHAEAAALLTTAFRIFERWGLDSAQARRLLGEPSLRTFQRWKAGDVRIIPSDTVWRLGDIIGIHKALRYLFSDPERAYDWVRRANLAFGGKSALDRMLAGAPSDLSAVRGYLDAERGGW
jgi:hypothetical protein